MIDLQTSWLGKLKNADHVTITTQIYENAKAKSIANTTYKEAVKILGQAIADEDEAYKKTLKDWAVEELKKVDQDLDDYMKGLRSILAGYAAMPDSEELKQKAAELLQLWKEYKFQTHDSYSAESAKVINMFQEVGKHKTAAEALGVWTCFEKAEKLAVKVQNLLNDRFSDLATRIVGELKMARTATDTAIKQLYQVVVSLQTLMPEETVTDLAKKLRAIEDYARIYYLKTGASRADDTPTAPPSSGGGTGGGDDEDDGMPPPGGGE